MTTGITKEEALMFPKIYILRYYKDVFDRIDSLNEIYTIETVVNNKIEESRFRESINHEAILTIEVKLPNGVIK